METEITAEQFYERLAKLQEEKSNPKVSNDRPLMICANKNCNAKYILPIPYLDCNEGWRDLCPNCLLDRYEKEVLNE